MMSSGVKKWVEATIEMEKMPPKIGLRWFWLLTYLNLFSCFA